MTILTHTTPADLACAMAPAGSTNSELTRPRTDSKAFENASTSVAANQMRNALNALAETCKDEDEKERFETEMDNFFGLFRRYLNDKARTPYRGIGSLPLHPHKSLTTTSWQTRVD